MTSVFRVPMLVPVLVTVTDADVIERVTGPKGDEWRSYAYPLRSRDDVLGHLAFNAMANGIQQVCDLDGWADVSVHAAKMELHRHEATSDFDLHPVELVSS